MKSGRFNIQGITRCHATAFWVQSARAYEKGMEPLLFMVVEKMMVVMVIMMMMMIIIIIMKQLMLISLENK